jgi:hypothetical protein
MKTYATEAKAMARANRLIDHGIWPALIRWGDRWRLSHDPDLVEILWTP